MLKYLDKQETQKARALWEEVFSEDSSSFNDFYFTEVAGNNRILTSWENGEMAAMLHRNPYQVMVKGAEWTADYIAGVATAPKQRHRGHMRRLICRALADMYAEGREFTFLMPADRKIYEPFDFTYIFEQPQWELNQRGRERLFSETCQEKNGSYLRAADFLGEFLSGRYEVYCKKDAAYLERLHHEVVSDGGDFTLLYTKKERSLAGVRAYYGLGKDREMLCLPEYVEESGNAVPAIMARIVNLEKFVKAICLSEDAPMERAVARLWAEDALIAENGGAYLWQLDKKGSRLVRPRGGLEPDGQELGELRISIREMTEWLFGYGSGEKKIPEYLPPWSGLVRTLKGVYLDEIV